MSFIHCYELANEVIEDATERFAPEYRDSDELRQEFDETCEIIDEFIEDTLAEGFEVDVDDERKDIIITVETICLEVRYPNHAFFYEAVERCKAFSFSRNEVGDLVITFRFPGIWRKVASHE